MQRVRSDSITSATGTMDSTAATGACPLNGSSHRHQIPDSGSSVISSGNMSLAEKIIVSLANERNKLLRQTESGIQRMK